MMDGITAVLLVAAFVNIICSVIAIATKNAEGQLFSVFVSFILITFSVIYDRPIIALVGGLTIALIIGFHAFKSPEQ